MVVLTDVIEARRVYPPTIPDRKIFEYSAVLMRDITFLIQAAQACQAAYEQATNSAPTELFSAEEISVLKRGKDTLESEADRILYDRAQQKLAINLAGFYALSEGIGIIQRFYGDRNPQLAYTILKALAEGKVIDSPKLIEARVVPIPDPNPSAPLSSIPITLIPQSLDIYSMWDIFTRLAHATWIAGQPFRGREQRSVIMPFDELSEAEQAKDWAQIVAIARVLFDRLNLDLLPPTESAA